MPSGSPIVPIAADTQHRRSKHLDRSKRKDKWRVSGDIMVSPEVCMLEAEARGISFKKIPFTVSKIKLMSGVETNMADDRQNGQYKIVNLDVKRRGARQYLIKAIESGLALGIYTYKIRVPETDSAAFPSMCVPVSGVIDYYRRQKNCAFVTSGSLRKSAYLYQTSFLNPKEFTDENTLSVGFLDKVWRFCPEDEYSIVSGIVRSIRSKISLEPGVIESIELCLHEILDNVLIHSQPKDVDSQDIPCGYVMAQCHHDNSSIAFAVFDNGQGIPQSFSGSRYNPKTPEEAIELALSKNVTSGLGQGRGMWILASIVGQSGGQIEISSDKVRYTLRHSERSEGTAQPVFSKVGSEITGTTLVDFRLRTDRAIDIARALDGYYPTDLWLEDHEINDDVLLFSVRKESNGTGTRYAAKHFRNIVENSARQKEQRVTIDFSNTGIVSSSYADELIGALIEKYGFIGFIRRFDLINLTETNALIINEAITARIKQQ